MWQCPKCGEPSEDTFEVCWSCGTGKDGSEDPSFRRADEVPAAEDADVTAPPAPDDEPDGSRARIARCPACRGTHVRTDGWAAGGVRVQFGSSWIGPLNAGYPVTCSVCLDCGFVGFWLRSSHVEALRPSAD